MSLCDRAVTRCDNRHGRKHNEIKNFRVISFEPLERFLPFFHRNYQQNVYSLVPQLFICAGPRLFSTSLYTISFRVASFEPLERILPFFHQNYQPNVSSLVALLSICAGPRPFSTSLYTIFKANFQYVKL